jgi:hypothetical protein
MQAAPLWHPVQCQFVGLLTVTDFIDILRHYRNNGNGNNNVGGDAAVGNDATGEKQQQQKPKDVSELRLDPFGVPNRPVPCIRRVVNCCKQVKIFYPLSMPKTCVSWPVLRIRQC